MPSSSESSATDNWRSSLYRLMKLVIFSLTGMMISFLGLWSFMPDKGDCGYREDRVLGGKIRAPKGAPKALASAPKNRGKDGISADKIHAKKPRSHCGCRAFSW